MKKGHSFLLIAFVFLASCGFLAKDSDLPQVLPPVSVTAFPTTTLLIQATFTPSPTEKVEIIHTPLPTLSSQEPSIVVKELMEKNGGCKLPCWWGVLPGQTRWQAVEKLLSPIANSIYKSTGANPNSDHIEMLFPAPYPMTGEFRQVYLVDDDVVERIEILPQQFSKYSVPNGLIQELGVPEMVFLGGAVDQPQSFQLILYYPSRGVFALYSSELHPAQQREMLEVCFTEDTIDYTDIFLWDPINSFSETLDYIFIQYERRFYEIELVTDLTINELVATFESSSQVDCLQTPSDFWRN